MDFTDGLKDLAEKIIDMKDQINSEEAAKNAFIMPFFRLLGYDTSNPLEFIPEFTADIGEKKGEKVDYAICIEDQPKILIEAKWCENKNLKLHDNQLIRYFNVTNAKIGILTNGVLYKFYTDLEETNKMDKTPFLEIDILDIKDNQITELKKFGKENFNIDNILSTAEVLKYSNAIKRLISTQIDNPEEHFVNYILSQVYEGRRTQKVKDKFKDIIRKSVYQVINDMVRNKLETALATKEETEENIEDQSEELEIEPKNKIVTTEEELSGFYIAKSIFSEFTDSQRITYKDTVRYFNILLDDNTFKWLCRLYLNFSKKSIVIPVYDESGKRIDKNRYYIDSVEDLYGYKKELKEVFLTLDKAK